MATFGYFARASASPLLALVALSLSACATEPLAAPHPPPPTVPPMPDTNVYMYPTAGQSETQQERDRYECHVWAVRQSGFDPSAQYVPPHDRVQVVSAAPAGEGTLQGAATGAIIGAAVSRPRDASTGAVIGAIAGGILGNAADQARAQQAARLEDAINNQRYGQSGSIEARAQNYRRAISACLTGRGYTVK